MSEFTGLYQGNSFQGRDYQRCIEVSADGLLLDQLLKSQTPHSRNIIFRLRAVPLQKYSSHPKNDFLGRAKAMGRKASRTTSQGVGLSNLSVSDLVDNF